MKCPICDNELRRSKKDSSYGLCDNCRKKIKWVDEYAESDYEYNHKTSKQPKNKKNKWIKPVVICVAAFFIIGIIGNLLGIGTDETSESEQKKSNTASDNTKNEKSKSNQIPGLKGSQAYDIIIELENRGTPKADTVSTSDGFQFDSTTSTNSYSITTNSKHEVMNATFMVLNGQDTEGYLSFCASMPYDTSDVENARSWVESNIGQEASTQIGDAIYILSNGTQGPYLTIKDSKYDAYVKSTIIE